MASRAATRLLSPARERGAGAGDASAALFSVADSLSLIIFPWFLMGAFHSLLDLTLKAAYAAVTVAALAAGNDLGRRLGGRLGLLPPRLCLVLLAALMALCGGALNLVPAGTALDVAICTVAALATGFLLAGFRPLPRRSFPFAPRQPAAATVAAVDLAAFGAVLAMLLLTATGPLLVFALLALLYLALAAFARPEAVPEAAAASEPNGPPPALPHRVEDALAWAYRTFLGEVGVKRAAVISDAASLAYQALFALAVYKIVVHMEFTALALGLLVACGAAGEFATRGLIRRLGTQRQAAVAIFVAGLWTLGMFAGLAGSAFPPLEFVFWAGAAAGAAVIDQGRAELATREHGIALAPTSPMLGAPRLVVMVFSGYLVWWLSTFISKPHSINLVLTMAGALVGAALVWVVLPASVGRHEALDGKAPRLGAGRTRPAGSRLRQRRLPVR